MLLLSLSNPFRYVSANQWGTSLVENITSLKVIRLTRERGKKCKVEEGIHVEK